MSKNPSCLLEKIRTIYFQLDPFEKKKESKNLRNQIKFLENKRIRDLYNHELDFRVKQTPFKNFLCPRSKENILLEFNEHKKPIGVMGCNYHQMWGYGLNNKCSLKETERDKTCDLYK